MIDKHFNEDNILHKIFNRKSLKISYSWIRNFFKIINTHNNKIIRKYYDQMNRNNNNNNDDDNNNNTSKENDCNCKITINCPMKGSCNFKKCSIPRDYFPKENIKIKNLYRNFIDKMEIKV